MVLNKTNLQGNQEGISNHNYMPSVQVHVGRH